ncbi:MAG: hypothetical protein Q8P90_05555 [bacterium]|nr:hypothetical protein [bacterium]
MKKILSKKHVPLIASALGLALTAGITSAYAHGFDGDKPAFEDLSVEQQQQIEENKAEHQTHMEEMRKVLDEDNYDAWVELMQTRNQEMFDNMNDSINEDRFEKMKSGEHPFGNKGMRHHGARFMMDA